MMNYRMEHDLIGERRVPADRYNGIQTLRALENYQITGIQISHYPEFIRSLAFIKAAAARANVELVLLGVAKARAISEACDEILNGHLYTEFVVDVIQGGAGTSTCACSPLAPGRAWAS